MAADIRLLPVGGDAVLNDGTCKVIFEVGGACVGRHRSRFVGVGVLGR